MYALVNDYLFIIQISNVTNFCVIFLHVVDHYNLQIRQKARRRGARRSTQAD